MNENVTRDYFTTEHELFGEGGKFYCSFKPDTEEQKRKLYKAMNAPDKKLSDCMGQVIKVCDVFAQKVELMDGNTGEMKEGTRVVLIDDKGISYHAVSSGVYNSLQKLMLIYGEPTWKDGVSVKLKQVSRDGGRRMFCLDLA